MLLFHLNWMRARTEWTDETKHGRTRENKIIGESLPFRVRCERERVHKEQQRQQHQRKKMFFLFKLKPLIEMIFGWDSGVIYGTGGRCVFTAHQIVLCRWTANGSAGARHSDRWIYSHFAIYRSLRLSCFGWVASVFGLPFFSIFFCVVCAMLKRPCHTVILFRCRLFCKMKTKIHIFPILFCVCDFARRYIVHHL